MVIKKMKRLSRIIRHLFVGPWLVRRYFTKQDLKEIAQKIAISEKQHRAEIRVALQAGLEIIDIMRGVEARQKAIEAFSQLGIWDTEENNGVLIYLLLAERRLEIIADRGIHSILGQRYWEKIHKEMLSLFRSKQYKEGVLYALEHINTKMMELFPKQGEDPDELPNEVVIL